MEAEGGMTRFQVRPLKMTERLAGLVTKYWQDVWESKRNGRLVAWCSGGSPHELIRAMDITVVFPEGYGGFCAMADMSTELCQRAEAVGYSQDLCSVVRNFIGVTHGIPAPEPEMLPYGGLPKPDLLMCQPYCPGVYKMWEKYSRFFNVPLLVMERPRLHDALSKEEIAHIVKDGIEELQEVITFLQRFTGQRLDYDRLSQSVAFEREASRLWFDTLKMCQNIPAPMSIFDASNHMYPFYLYRGEPKAVTYYQELKAEMEERIAQKIVPMASEEKYRLYWDNAPIIHKTKEHIEKFASHGAVPVAAIIPFYFGYPDLDPEKPLKSIVEFWLLNPMNRGVKRKIDFLTKLVEDYSVDGLVMQRFRTCLLNNMGQGDVTEALTKKTGLPAVVLEGDPVDSRYYSDSEFNSKIDAFMEILAQRGSRRS